MAHEQIDLNETVVIRLEFITAADVWADPTAITLTITRPDGTTIVVNKAGLTKDADGRFHYNQPGTQNGVWTWEAVSLGVVDDTQDGLFLVGASTHQGPCDDWLLPEELFDCAPCRSIASADRDAGLAARAATAASELLYVASQRKFPGLCESTVRPCQCTCFDRSQCSCSGGPLLRLPGPVLGIIEVRIDGSVLAATAYRLEEHRFIRRIDGSYWPTWQDMDNDPASEIDTFQVRYLRGRVPPESGILAAQDLACELYRGFKGEECRLPTRTVTVARQGVNMTLVRPQEIGVSSNGEIKTGLASVDLFLGVFGGGKRRRRAGIASPDVGPLVRRTG